MEFELTVKNSFESKKTLNGFKAGLNDFTGQYKQSQKLYGRGNEINELLGYYHNLNHLQPILILVTGYSGIGKSALIRHVKVPIIQNQGTLISGRFDQFKKNIPYYTFIEVVSEFIKNLLSESEVKISSWRNKILNAIGENSGLITEVIPLPAAYRENEVEKGHLLLITLQQIKKTQ